MRFTRAEVQAFHASARAFEGWLRPPKVKADGKPAKRKPAGGPALIARTIAEVTEIHTAREWHRAQPRHFVALYAWLHEQVYAVKPVELEREWAGAVSAARALLKNEFAEDPTRMMAFMQWVWAREKIDEKKRDASNSFRVGWKYQFVSRALVSNYRVAMTRAGKAK